MEILGNERFHDPGWKFLHVKRMEIADILSWTFRPIVRASFPNGGWKNPWRVRKVQVSIFERNGILSELLEEIPGTGKRQYHFGATHQICHHNQQYPNAVYGTSHMQHSGFVGSEY